MYKTQIYELIMTTEHNEFKKIIEIVRAKSRMINIQVGEYVDDSLADKGMLVIFHDSKCKKKIRVAINVAVLCDLEKVSSEVLLKKINKLIQKYFKGNYQLDDFKLHKTLLVRDIDVNSKKNVQSYLKVLHKTNFVKSYSRWKNKDLKKDSYFGVKGNSNGVEFQVYDLEEQLKLRCVGDNKRKYIDGILRTEIGFSKYKELKKLVKASTTSEYLSKINEDHEKIYLQVFSRIVPFGEFYKKEEAEKILRQKVKDTVLRRKMLRLMTLIPEKKSLWLAQKAMKCREIDRVMTEFAKINLAPVTLSTRQDLKELDNLYNYLI